MVHNMQFDKYLLGVVGACGIFMVYVSMSRVVHKPTSVDSIMPMLKQSTESFQANQEQRIRNVGRFPGGVRRHTPVLVVQVDRDEFRLRQLVASLAHVSDIHTVLLVFSHAYRDDQLDNVIASINFCLVAQIYFPRADVSERKESCSVAGAAQRKMHWWWKAHFVFDRAAWAARHDGPVIFLEEDNYVSPDLVYMLRYLEKSYTYFPQVDVASLGKPYLTRSRSDLLILEPWSPPFGVGLIFNSSIWKRVKMHYKDYCLHDDCDWSYSLLKVFESFPLSHANMLACSTPRIMTTKQFEREELSKRAKEFVDNNLWFPRQVSGVFVQRPEGLALESRAATYGTGGWRDRQLQQSCLNILTEATPTRKE